MHRAPFRQDIQGLRALAVLLVLVYHTGALGVSGGYAGVDVFFVISGFLITNHLLSHMEREGRIDLPGFWARRVRRILPASFTVLAATLVAALLFLPPALRRDSFLDGVWTALYIPNIAFAAEGTDYLAEAAPSVFQHYWSLGVEEQFYLLWPIVLMLLVAAVRRSRRALTLAVAIMVLASFALCVWLTYRSQPWAFFGLPTRAWELGVGALVALLGPELSRRVAGPARAVLAWSGLAMVLAAGVLYDATTPFPGYTAALPVVGTALVIFMGQTPTPWGPSRMLSVAPFRFVGEISYSLYLVHWPLLVIPAAAIGRAFGPEHAIAFGALAVPVAYVLYRFVEEPVRRSRRIGVLKPRWSVGSALTGSAVIVAGSLVLIPAIASTPLHSGREATPLTQLTPSPMFGTFVPSNLRPALADVADDVSAIHSSRNSGCHLDVATVAVQDCAFGDVDSSRSIALFGDSHAGQWFPALEEIARAEGMRLDVFTKSSCPSVDHPITVKSVPYAECEAWRDLVIDHLARTGPDLVVISNMADQPDQPGGAIDPTRWADGLASVIERLGGVPVAVISDTPRMTATPSICLSAHLASAWECNEPRARAERAEWIDVEATRARAAGALVININDYLCDSETCGVIIGNVLVYRDAHHLTATFARELSAVLHDGLRPVLTSTSARPPA